jgi:hypothetical protein
MTKSVFGLTSIGLGLALLCSSRANGQSHHGEMGPQSRASIRISISVAPRVRLEGAATSAQGRPDTARVASPPFTMTSNTPRLSYSVIANTNADLLIVIPD